jgi:hypothetical protein
VDRLIGGGVFLVGVVILLVVLLGGGSGPTRANAVQALRNLADALETRDYDRAEKILWAPPDVKLSPALRRKAMDALLTRQEISRKGVEILAERGTWGTLTEVFGDRARGWAERNKVPLHECYGLRLAPAEAGFFWDGKGFRVIRCDDIGKLQ